MKKRKLFSLNSLPDTRYLSLGALLCLLMLSIPLQAQIDVNLVPTSPTCNGYTDGFIDAQVSGGVAPYNYTWSNGQTTEDLYSVSAGTYSVVVNDGSGNTGTAEITVGEPDLLVVEIGVVGNVCLGTQGSLQAVVSGGTEPYDIMWNNGTTGTTNDNLQEGANTVNVTDANGCIANAIMIVGVPMSIELVTTDVACGGGCDGSVEVIVTGGQGPYTYLWSNGETGPILQNLEAGEYCVTVTDNLGCSLNDCGTVGEPTSIDVTLDVVYDEVECGEPVTATATVTVSGGEPPYTITWSNGATGPVVTGLTPGSYSVNVQDQSGCVKTLNFKIEKPPVLTCDIETTQPDCEGGTTGSATISGMGGTAPYTYLWSNGATTATVNDLAPGNYTATVTDAIGCEAICYTTINEEGTVGFYLTATHAVCAMNGSIDVTITDGVAPYDISWVGPINGSVDDTNDNPYTISDLTPGQYLVTVQDANGCIGTQTIRINDSGDIRFQLFPTSSLCGGSNGSIQVNVSTGTPDYRIEWTGPVDGSVDDVTSPYTITGLPAGEYTVTVIDANGCFESHTTTVGNEDYDIPLTVESSCDGAIGSVSVSWTVGEAPFTMEWTTPGSTDVNTENAVESPFELNSLTVNGIYAFTITDANGCTGTGSDTLNCDGGCTLVCTTTSTPAICEAENGTITVTVSGADGDVNITVDSPTATVVDNMDGTYTIADLASGDYEITVTDADDPTCQTTCSANVGLEDIDLAPSATFVCNDSLATITVTWSGSTAPDTLVWTAPGGTPVEVPNATSPFVLNNQTANGVYTFEVRDAYGCDGSTEISVECPDPCPLTCSATSTPAICEANNGSITLTVGGADGPINIDVVPAVGSIFDNMDGTYTLQGVAPGDYVITVTDVDDPECFHICEVEVGREDIDLDPSASFECNDSLSTITVTWGGSTAPDTLVWTAPDGTTEEVADVTSPFVLTGQTDNGLYTFEVRDTYGCDGSTSILVQCPMDSCLLSITAASTPALCEAQNGTITVNVSNNVGPYSVTLTPGSTVTDITDPSYTFTDLAPGDYIVVVEDSIACMAMTSISVGQDDYDLGLTVSDECNGSLGTLTIGWQAINLLAPYTLSWTDPADNMFTEQVDTSPYVLEGLILNGTYSFTITDTPGSICIDTASVELICPPPCFIFASSTPEYCDSGNGTITIDSLQNVTGLFSISWNGPGGSGNTSGDASILPFTITDLAAGDYEIVVVDENNTICETTITVGAESYDIDVNASYTCNADSTGNITVTWGGSNAPDTLIWSGPNGQGATVVDATSPYTLDNVVNGNYIFTVIDAQGCDGTDSVTVVCPPPPECELECAVSSTPVTCIDSVGTITVTVANNVGPYSITLTPGGTVTDITDPSYTFTDLAPGNYTVVVTDSIECTITKMIEVADERYDIPLSITTDCVDSLATIVVTWSAGVAPYELVWSGPNGQGATVPDASSPFTLSGLADNGVYTFMVTDSLGCEGTNSVNIECPLPPECELECVVSSTPITCIDSLGTITVAVSGNVGPYSVTLTPPGTTVTGITDPSYTFFDLPAGTYTVVVTDSINCSITRTIEIEDESYDIPLTVTPECSDTSGTVTVSWSVGVAPFTLTWTGPNGSGGTENNATSPFVLSGLGLDDNGTYSFSITDSLGCSGSGSTELDCCYMRISAESTPEECLGDNGTITVTISNGTAPYDIDWSGTESGSVSTSDNPYTITDLTAGSYTVVVTDAEDCVDSLDIVVERIDTLSFDTDSRDIICETPGEICITNISGNPDYDISWDGPETGNITISEDSICLSISTPGDYVISITDSLGCMATSDTITIDSVGLTFDVKPKNRVCETFGSIDICEITGQPDYEIMWTGPVSGIDTTSNNDYTIDSLVEGTYVIKITDANGCMNTDTVMIDSLDMLPFNTEVTPVICDRRGEICVSMDCGTPDFEVSLVGPVSDTITTDSAYCFSDLPAGEYIVTVTDSFGCMGIDTITVDSIDNLEIEAMVTDGLCGDSANIDVTILSGTPDFDIMWTGPSPASSGMDSTANNDYRIDITETGDYTIKVTDDNGCMRDTTVTVIVSPPKEITAEAIDATCDSLGKINVTILSGTPECTISWEGPVSGSDTTSQSAYSICDLPRGDYTVIATDIYECADTVTVTINGPDSVLVDIESMPQMCDSLGSIKLTYITGNGPIMCLIEGPQTSTDVTLNGPNDMATIGDLVAGEYVITCTDSLGCTGLDTIIIIENLDILEFTATPFGGECTDDPGRIDIDITAGMSPFTIEWTGPVSGSDITNNNNYSIPALPAGEYFIKVTDNKGCMRDTTVTVVIFPAVSYDVEVIDITCDDPGAIIISNITGTPDYSITITGPGVDTMLLSMGGPDTLGGLTEQGTYQIFVDDSIGCDGDTTIEVGGPEEIRITVDPVDMICDTPGSIKFTYDCGFGTATGMVIAPDGTIKEFTLENVGDMFICDELTEGDYEIEITDEGDNTFTEVIRIERVITEIDVTITASSLTTTPDGSVEITVVVDPPGDYTYSWDITETELISDPNSPTPTLTPCITRTYTVTVVDANGCVGQASITIEVPPICEEPNQYIYIPNAFAPNENDVNEVFRIRSAFLEELTLVTFIVYDRWGEEVFKAGNVKEGWDGTFKGKECPPDVFGYYIDVVCPDGSHFIKKGNVTLFR